MTILKLILEKLKKEYKRRPFENDDEIYNAREYGYNDGLDFAIKLIENIIKEMREDK